MANTNFLVWTLLLITRTDFIISKLMFNSYTKTQCVHVNCTYVSQIITPSRADCLGYCLQNDSCYGVRIPGDKSCYLLPHTCFHPQICSNLCEKDLCFEKTFCVRGYWSDVSRKCECSTSHGYVGVHCERLPHNCTDLFDHGYGPITDWFLIDIYKNGSQNISVMCDLTSNTIYTYIARNTGWKKDNSTLSNYIYGYYVDDYNFFMGLQDMLSLNQQGFSDVTVSILLNYDGAMFGWYNNYNGFQISDGTSGYQLNVGTHEPYEIFNTSGLLPGKTLGDVLERSSQVRFSAYDSDNDLDPSHNCAAMQGVGWWYKNCTDVNLFGTLDDGTLRVPGLNLSDPELISLFDIMNFFFYVYL